MGVGIICFDQATFDNPFADSKAEITIGSTIITVDSHALVASAVQKGCSANGCDPTSPFTEPFDHFNNECTLTVTMNGNFVGTNERDYMAAILEETVSQATTNQPQDLTGSTANNDVVFDVPAFVQVEITDQEGDQQSLMAATVTVDCQPPSPGNCDGLLGTITAAIFGAIPGVGGVLAKAFDVVCASSG